MVGCAAIADSANAVVLGLFGETVGFDAIVGDAASASADAAAAEFTAGAATVGVDMSAVTGVADVTTIGDDGGADATGSGFCSALLCADFDIVRLTHYSRSSSKAVLVQDALFDLCTAVQLQPLTFKLHTHLCLELLTALAYGSTVCL